MKALEEDDSETRLDAVRLTDELFKRSHLFRTLLLEHFEKFMELVAETNLDLPLPGSEVCNVTFLKYLCLNDFVRGLSPGCS